MRTKRYITLKAFVALAKASVKEDNVCFADSNFLRINGYRYLGYGRHRIVFKIIGKNWVLKIPYRSCGEEANSDEAMLFKTHKGVCFPKESVYSRGRLARCRVVKIGGLKCLLMEHLRRPSNYDHLPDWTRMLRDGEQIGYDKKGRLKAYDYSLEKYQ